MFDVDDFSEEATGIMLPLPPAPRFKKTRTLKHTQICHGNGCGDGEQSAFFECGDEQSDVLQKAVHKVAFL